MTLKHLPRLLDMVQMPFDAGRQVKWGFQGYQLDDSVSKLSYVYKVMQKWDEAIALYESWSLEAIPKKV